LIKVDFSIYFLNIRHYMSLNERLKYAKMKARHKKVFLPWYKKLWGKLLIVALFGLFLLLTFSAIYVYKEVKRIQTKEAESYIDRQRDAYLKLINGAGGYAIGSPDAKITLIEFTDFACPFCRDSALEIMPLLQDYQETVRLIIRDFPIHENSIDLALAMRCAGE
jgi:hypothetical protein